MTPAGIEQVTFRFVAQHLNHRATAVHVTSCIHSKYNGTLDHTCISSKIVLVKFAVLHVI